MKSYRNRKNSSSTEISPDLDLRLFREITDAVPAMIAVYNIRTGEYIYVNRAVRKLLGYKPTDFMKRGLAFVSSLVHLDDIGMITEKNLKALKKANNHDAKKSDNGPIVNFEYRMRHYDGTYRWLHTDGSVFKRDARGKVEYVLNISIDITDRKHTEEKLRLLHEDLEERVNERTEELKRIEQRYQRFVSQSTEGIWRFELEKPLSVKTSVKKQLDHFYAYAFLAECNDAMARMYGFKRAEDIIGVRLGDLLIADNPANIEYLKDFIQSGYNLTDAESIEADKSGVIRYFQNNLIGIVEDGYLMRAWGIQRDITEKRKSDEALKNSRDQLETILTSVADGISVQDTTGKLLFANPAIAKATGFRSQQEMLDAPPAEFLNRFEITYENGDPLPLTQLPGRRALLGEKTAKETVRFVNKKTGEVRWAVIKATPVFDGSGKVKFAINIIQDITAMKKLEKQKDEFLSIASHELKTPVTSLKAYAQVLRNRFARDGNLDSAEHLAKMDMQLDKLTSLIVDLLDVTKIEGGRLQFHEEYFDFNELVSDMVEQMQRTTLHKILIRFSRSKTVFGDRDRIGQVIMNFITNAIKYSPDSDKVIVKTLFDTNHATLAVRDYGVGIPAESKHHVFERFFRVSGPGKDTYPGLGLGLFISSEIIKRHRGRIWVESKVGKGSTFYFTLPLPKGSAKRTKNVRKKDKDTDNNRTHRGNKDHAG